jgi:hypothetical protein
MKSRRSYRRKDKRRVKQRSRLLYRQGGGDPIANDQNTNQPQPNANQPITNDQNTNQPQPNINQPQPNTNQQNINQPQPNTNQQNINQPQENTVNNEQSPISNVVNNIDTNNVHEKLSKLYEALINSNETDENIFQSYGDRDNTPLQYTNNTPQKTGTLYDSLYPRTPFYGMPGYSIMSIPIASLPDHQKQYLTNKINQTGIQLDMSNQTEGWKLYNANDINKSYLQTVWVSSYHPRFIGLKFCNFSDKENNKPAILNYEHFFGNSHAYSNNSEPKLTTGEYNYRIKGLTYGELPPHQQKWLSGYLKLQLTELGLWDDSDVSNKIRSLILIYQRIKPSPDSNKLWFDYHHKSGPEELVSHVNGKDTDEEANKYVETLLSYNNIANSNNTVANNNVIPVINSNNTVANNNVIPVVNSNNTVANNNVIPVVNSNNTVVNPNNNTVVNNANSNMTGGGELTIEQILGNNIIFFRDWVNNSPAVMPCSPAEAYNTDPVDLLRTIAVGSSNTKDRRAQNVGDNTKTIGKLMEQVQRQTPNNLNNSSGNNSVLPVANSVPPGNN